MTVALVRDPQGAAAGSHDLIVIGGGFQGVMLTLEAARRGLKTLLVERDDFGGATSWNSLRIVHGGLRYLQSFDLRRYHESVAERSWFLRTFPDLVDPLPCLMPLWSPPRGGALRRRSALGAALAADRLLARERNAGLRADRQLPAGRLLDAKETAELFPDIDRGGLRGGALWYDAVISDTPRLLVEALRWACRCGAGVLNYAEVTGLSTDDSSAKSGRVSGVEAVDRETGRRLRLRATAVVNCAGPWSRRLAETWDRDLPELFRPVLAFNLLLDCAPPSRAALAVAAPGRGAQTWFLLPWKGRLLAGTAYVPAGPQADFSTGPDEERIEAFLAALNAAVPSLGGVRRDRIQRVFWGWLPAAGSSPRSYPVIHDHGAAGGPRGLISVSGVKLTTSRAVAEEVLERLFAQRGEALPAPGWIERPAPEPPLPLGEFIRLAGRDRAAAAAHLRGIVERESVVRLDDLLLRRTDWGLSSEASEASEASSAAQLCEALGWAAGERAPRHAGGGL